jgi:hypothetical protein
MMKNSEAYIYEQFKRQLSVEKEQMKARTIRKKLAPMASP